MLLSVAGTLSRELQYQGGDTHSPGCRAPARLLSTTPDTKPQSASHTARAAETEWEKEESCISLARQPCSASPFLHQESRLCDLMEEIASETQKSPKRFAR